MELPSSKWLDPSEAFLGETRLAWRNSSSTRISLSARGKLLLEVLMVLMCVGAVTGNILVIVIVVATKTFHSVTSVLIINLAISDFLVGIGVMPFVAVSIMNNKWVNDDDLCLYVGYTSSVYCTASVLTIAAIALDRYFSIVDCLRYDSRCTAWRTGAAVLWIWLQAMLTSSPPLLGWSDFSFVKPMYSCAVNWASSPSYTVFMAAFSFFLPATVILFCYVKIVRVARHHARRIHSLEEHIQRNRGQRLSAPSESTHPGSTVEIESHDPSKLVYYVSGRFVSEAQFSAPEPVADLEENATPQLEEECSSKPPSRRLQAFLAHLQSGSTQQNSNPQHHGVVRLFIVIAAFFLCWTPYIGVALVQATETALSRSGSQVPPAAVTFSYWLVLFNSDINPLLYALLSKRFQAALQNIRQKIQARLGGVVGRGGEGRTEREGGGCITPTNVTTANVEQLSRDNGPQRSSVYSTVFTVNTPFPKRYRERTNNVPLPGSVSSTSSFSTSSSSCSIRHNYSRNSQEKSDCLQVPSKAQEWDRLPSSGSTVERQATFFYGEITVRVEHEIC